MAGRGFLYAIEILKLLFPYLLDKDYLSGEEFIDHFSLFTKKMLAKRGICSLAAFQRLQR